MENIDTYLYKQNNNYNLIRFIAALCVLFSHCYPLSLGKEAASPLYGCIKESLGAVAVYVFCAISGFLVTRSCINAKNIFIFIENRFLRIYPALVVCVLLSVFLLGSFFTVIPLKDYFSNRHVYGFLFYNSTLYRIRYELPGVFLDNPYPNAVNGSLWVLPLLIKMYILTGILGLSTILRKPAVFNILCTIILSVLIFCPDAVFDWHGYVKPSFAFLLGMCLYVNRSAIPVNGYVAILLCLMTSLFYKESFYWVFFQITLAYTIIWLALVPTSIFHFFSKCGDYSYGLYIYAFPIQQILAASIKNISPLQMALYASLLAFAFAWLSWHFIEKYSMRCKGKLFQSSKEIVKRGIIKLDKLVSQKNCDKVQ